MNNDTPENSDAATPSTPEVPSTPGVPSSPTSPSNHTIPSSPSDPSSHSAPTSPSRHARHSRPPRTPVATITAFLGALIGIAVLGIPAGYIWALVAPRALARVVSHGAANVTNPETAAFIVADAWFVLIATVGGLLTGILGYRYVVRRRAGAAGPAAALGLILGGLGATALMWWIGYNYGRASFHHALLTRPAGTYLHASLSLGAKSALIFWPLFAALAIGLPELVAYVRADRSPGVRNVDEDGGHEARSVD